MPECDDLRLGGTLSGTGITGGMSINGTAIMVDDWSGVLGNPGLAYTPVEISGRPGGLLVGDGLMRARFPILNLRFLRLGPGGILVEPTECEQLEENTDDFLTMLADPDGQYLELDMADGTSRFLKVWAIDPASMRQPQAGRTIGVPLVSPWPFWREGGNQSSDTISGADTLVVGGRVKVYDAVLVFAGDGTFTHSTLGWTLEIAGSSGAVTVDLGNRTVTQGGNPADHLLTRNNRDWGWFTPGNNSVTSDVSVGVSFRAQYN